MENYENVEIFKKLFLWKNEVIVLAWKKLTTEKFSGCVSIFK